MNRLYGCNQYLKVVLSPNYNDITEDFKINIITFPGGEIHVKIEDPHMFLGFGTEPIRIYHTIKSFNDLGILCMTVDAFRRKSSDNLYISLVLPYFPGARQDRIATDVIESFDAKVYAGIINNLKLNEVIIFDPHSDVTPAILNNCIVLNNYKFVREACPDNEDVIFISPDAGAAKKIDALFMSLSDWEDSDDGLPGILYFRKYRDMSTGKLSNFSVDNPVDLKGSSCVVVDDICDGGGTFLGVAKILKSLNAGKLHLIVSHGIFSKGIDELSNYYDTISTTNSWTYSPYSISKTDEAVLSQRFRIFDLIKLYDL